MSALKTSAEWWNEVKNSPEMLKDWLLKQYRGEVTAARRIIRLGEQFEAKPRQQNILNVIASQEEKHAAWIAQLLQARGIELPAIDEAENRYWAETLPGIEDFETGCAVAAHAEKMRLDRISAIAEDPESPKDIAKVMAMILIEEQFHESAFRKLATPEAMEKTRDNHERGMLVLGLSA